MNVKLRDKHSHWLTSPLCCLLLSAVCLLSQEADILKSYIPMIEGFDKKKLMRSFAGQNCIRLLIDYIHILSKVYLPKTFLDIEM